MSNIKKQQTVVLHRSISAIELRYLLEGREITGRYDIASEKQSQSKVRVPVIQTFAADVWWTDIYHKHLVILEVPESRIRRGVGDYWAQKNFAKTHIWTGRTGSEHYFIPEAYLTSYSLKDVKCIGLYQIPATVVMNAEFDKRELTKALDRGLRLVNRIEILNSMQYKKFNPDEFKGKQSNKIDLQKLAGNLVMLNIKSAVDGTMTRDKQFVKVQRDNRYYKITLYYSREEKSITRRVKVMSCDSKYSELELLDTIQLDKNTLTKLNKIIK